MTGSQRQEIFSRGLPVEEVSSEQRDVPLGSTIELETSKYEVYPSLQSFQISMVSAENWNELGTENIYSRRRTRFQLECVMLSADTALASSLRRR
jgi:hypothetical protein